MSFSKLINSEYIPKHEVDADNALIDEGYNPQHLKIHNKSVDLQEIAKFRKKEKERKSMYRADGTLKSDRGFLGPITNNVTNGTMTEVTVSFEDVLDNKEIPLLVPGQSAEDLDWLMNNPIEGNAQNFPQTMKDIAIEHAIKRTEEGKSVFLTKVICLKTPELVKFFTIIKMRMVFSYGLNLLNDYLEILIYLINFINRWTKIMMHPQRKFLSGL